MIPIPTVDYVAVLVAAIVGYIVGFLWYGPLFGKAWLKLSGIKPKRENMAPKMLAGFIATVVMTVALSHVLAYTQASTIMDAVKVAFFLWIGFFATTMLGIVLWEGKPVKLYAINALHYLVVLAVAGAILVSM